MGGGLEVDGQNLPAHVQERCQYIVSVKPNIETLIVTSSSFSLNLAPKLDGDKIPISEATIMRLWLIRNGILGNIVCEQQSHDSVGSIFFCMNLYAHYLGIYSIEFVTSDFHAPRVKFIANHINRVFFQSQRNINVVSIPSSCKILNREIHEGESLASYKKNFGDIEDPGAYFFKLITEHRNYNHVFKGDSVLNSKFLY